MEFLSQAKAVDLNLASVEKVSDLFTPGDSRLRVNQRTMIPPRSDDQVRRGHRIRDGRIVS